MRLRPPSLSRGRFVWYLAILVIAGILIYFLTIREMRFFLVPTKSMQPTIAPNEYLVSLKADQFARGDIVVLEDPNAPTDYLIKRIVALEGDRVEVRGGALFVNGRYVSEPYLPEPMDYALRTPYTVKDDEVFVLGDNRNWSVDSHDWSNTKDGPPLVQGVALDSLIGKIHLVYLPLRNMRRVEPYPLADVAGLPSKTAGP